MAFREAENHASPVVHGTPRRAFPTGLEQSNSSLVISPSPWPGQKNVEIDIADRKLFPRHELHFTGQGRCESFRVFPLVAIRYILPCVPKKEEVVGIASS